jgi:hypothetical protein
MTNRLWKKSANISGALAMCGAGMLAASVPEQAHASTWGCQVILCLATPGSPTTYAECVPPITRLWRTLAMGGSFPTCSEAGVSSRTRKLNGHLFYVQTTQADGKVSSYLIDTKRSQVTTVTR